MKFHKFITKGHEGRLYLTFPDWCYFYTNHFIHTYGVLFAHFKHFYIILPYQIWKIKICKVTNISKGYAIFDGETHKQID